ncbi:GntR family transcriptional regulator [Fodinicurvata sp. EGI_FJ10296]|uniref:GntR family transcriptional regulator n=1 Tax=Fodinicurvata sp. EGI_FJ10296 TaxID=3231908 RepID=UPI003452DAC1
MKIQRHRLSLADQVVDTMRQNIMNGRFQPGEKLVERELCDLLGVSRTSLREALSHLAAEGFIEHVPHRGPFVARVTADEAQAIYEVREVLEGLAGHGFTRHADADQRRQLHEAVADLGAQPEPLDRQQLVAIKNRIYAILLDGCRNNVVRETLTLLNNRIALLRGMSLSSPGRLQQTRDEMQAILDAIDTGDPENARAACQSHVRSAANVALDALRAAQSHSETATSKQREQRDE